MTVATVTADVRSIPDDGLLALYLADDDAARRAALAEAARRDRADQAAREREQVRAAWYDAAYAAYLQAEADCNGELVNRAGVAAGIRDGFQLWSGPRHFAAAYCTEELADWWALHGRLTIGEYRRQHAAGMREARLEALEQDTPADDDYAGAWDTEDTTEDTAICITREDTEDEHDTEDREDHDRDAAVDGPAKVGLRRVGTADAVRSGRDGRQHADAEAGPVRDTGPVQPAGRVMRNFADVAPRETMLLARRPWLVYGEVSLIYGAGSLGKGRLVNSIVAAVTNGEPVGLDESTEDDPGDVIVVLPEDKTEESAVKRLVAAGANLNRVWDMTRLPSGGRLKLSASDKSPGHLPELRAAVEQLRAGGGNPRLVVIDPIGAVIGEGSIQTSKGARLFVERLQDFAEQAGVVVLLVAHPVGSGKLQGNHALEQALRAVFHVRRDDTDASLRILACVKGNDVPPDAAGDIRFTIAGGPDGPRAEWVTAGQATPARVRARADWRDELAARRRAKTAHPAPVTPQRPAAAAPAVTWNAFTARAGQQPERLVGAAAEDMARMVCEARAGQPLQWQADGRGGWQAVSGAAAYAIAPIRTAGRATA